MRVAPLALLAACNGTIGTIDVSLVTAPDSHVLDSAQTLKLVLTNPHEVSMATRGPDGFAIEIDLPASNAVGAIIVDAFDASGALVATGASPPFPVGAIDASIAVYMAAPNSVGAAPQGLSVARTNLAVGALDYRGVFAGGSDGSGAASDAIEVYNSYDHHVVSGQMLPAPRSGAAVGIGANGSVYLFGGNDASGVATGTFWKFITTVQPAGAYLDFGAKTGFERAFAQLLPLGNDRFLLTGTPGAQVSGLDGMVATPTGGDMLPTAGASVIASDGVPTTILVGPQGVLRFRNGVFDMPDVPGAARTGAAVAAMPGGDVLIACGGKGAVLLDAATLAAQAFPNIPASPSATCGIAVTSRHVVIVTDKVEIFDGISLARVATQPLVVARTGASAIALPNDQVLIAGGAVTSTIELFTPEPTE